MNEWMNEWMNEQNEWIECLQVERVKKYTKITTASILKLTPNDHSFIVFFRRTDMSVTPVDVHALSLMQLQQLFCNKHAHTYSMRFSRRYCTANFSALVQQKLPIVTVPLSVVTNPVQMPPPSQTPPVRTYNLGGFWPEGHMT